MENSAEQQLLEALTQDTGSGARAQYLAIERLVSGLLGGQQHDLRGEVRGPDILIPRPDDKPIAVELKVFRDRSWARNFNNRVAELLAAAVETRRSFRGEVTLSAVLLITDSARDQSGHLDSIPPIVGRLLRSEDGVGYDSVLLGWAGRQLHWRYVAAADASGVSEEAPDILHSTMDAFRRLRTQRSAEHPPRSSPPGSRGLRILLVADEWASGRGGISTVNRELAIALSDAGVEAAVMVPHASDDDVRSASESAVALVAPARIPGLSDREALLLRPVFAAQGWEPDVIVGHGRLLGPYAAAQQQFFPQARRVHFVHTDAEQLEAAKETRGGDSHMTNADIRRGLERELARSADMVVGIGPLLTESIRDELIGAGQQSRVICLVPGLRMTFDTASAHPPVRNRVVIIGRADDFHSKGIDIAAEALLRVVDSWAPSKPHLPMLVIRGVPDEAANEVKSQLDAILEGRVTFILRPYSDSEVEVVQDLAQARVVIMPSRHEGFGLSAYEAIASGVPVLMSSESGLAQFLRDSGIDTFPTSIISTRNSVTTLAIDLWADAIQQVLDDPESARTQAVTLRQSIADLVSWKSSAAQLLDEINGLS
ncbi:glycosyltransferase family 4 protein [Micrococcaceae bacterium Sec5.1]